MNDQLRLITGIVNNTNIMIEGISVHVQTEVHMKVHKIVTSILYHGRVIWHQDGNFSQRAGDPNLRDLVTRGAKAQHNKVLLQMPIIWSELPTEIRDWVLVTEAQKPPIAPAELEYDFRENALELFERGLAAFRNEPTKALESWREAARVDPKLKSCQTNLRRLESKLAAK